MMSATTPGELKELQGRTTRAKLLSVTPGHFPLVVSLHSFKWLGSLDDDSGGVVAVGCLLA